MEVKLDLKLPSNGFRLCDSFSWDIANPENCPMDFAQALLHEKVLYSPDNVTSVAREIESQIQAHCAQLSLNLHRTVEALEDEDS